MSWGKVNYYSSTGEILGFYPVDISYSSIPEPYIEIDETTYQDCINNPDNRKVDLSSLTIVEGTVEVTQTTEEQIGALDATYQAKINSLAQDYATALMADAYLGTSTASDILTEYEEALADYATALEGIE